MVHLNTPLVSFTRVTLPLREGGGVARIQLTDWKPLKLSGWRGFRLQWHHADHPPAEPPLFWGIYSFGSRWVQPWADMAFHPTSQCPACGLELTMNDDWAIELFRMWAHIIPPGGHVSVEYESPEHQETLMGLKRGFPPVTTPLGFWGYMGGFLGGFKDWYISEGGHEGPRKLQIDQAAHADHARAVFVRLRTEVRAFLEHRIDADPMVRRARTRAERWWVEAPRLLSPNPPIRQRSE